VRPVHVHKVGLQAPQQVSEPHSLPSGTVTTQSEHELPDMRWIVSPAAYADYGHVVVTLGEVSRPPFQVHMIPPAKKTDPERTHIVLHDRAPVDNLTASFSAVHTTSTCSSVMLG
jgi:hypothetical protein